MVFVLRSFDLENFVMAPQISLLSVTGYFSIVMFWNVSVTEVQCICFFTDWWLQMLWDDIAVAGFVCSTAVGHWTYMVIWTVGCMWYCSQFKKRCTSFIMSTSLAEQLKKLSVPQTSILIQGKVRPSLLFDPREAAKFDRDTFYETGIVSFVKYVSFYRDSFCCVHGHCGYTHACRAVCFHIWIWGPLFLCISACLNSCLSL